MSHPHKVYTVFTANRLTDTDMDWIEQCFTSTPHSIGYMGDGFYRSKDATN